MSTITYIVKVASSKFTIDGAVAPKLTFRDGDTYIFDQSDGTNSGHTLQFSATSNNSGSSEYTTGVTKSGTAGSANAQTQIVTSSSTTDTIYYYSGSGSGDYGEEFSNTGFNTSTNFNLLKPIVGAESTAEKWGSMVNHMVDQIDQNISTLPYLDNTTTDQNLSGTYSTERMYFNDSYKLTGDVNITGHLALATAADSDVVITQDSTERTITGSGLLESGRLMNDLPVKLGTVTSGTLGSGVTFPAGHVIQVVSFSSATSQSTTSTSYVDSYLTKVITPSSTSSKILVLVSASAAVYKEPSGTDLRAHFQLVRDTKALETKQLNIHATGSGGRLDSRLPISFVYLDSPATTSATTYKVQYRADSGGAQTPSVYMQSGSHYSDITLMEVAG